MATQPPRDVKVRNKNNMAEADDLSAMREVWFTQKFLDNISQICRNIVNADDEQLQNLIRLAIDMSDQNLTSWVTDEIQYATLGTGNELAIFFIAEDIHVDTRSVIRKYTFIAAIADDIQISKIDSNASGKAGKLKRLSKLAIRSTIFYKIFKAIEESVIEIL